MNISTHILDTALGRPAADVAVSLARREGADWTMVQETRTDEDGRVRALHAQDGPALQQGTIFRLRFATAPYFAAQQQASLYPYIDIVFQIESRAHYHIPLLLSANGYTTYRGS